MVDSMPDAERRPLTDLVENALTARFEKTPLETVEALVHAHFGLQGNACVLNSERDETFRLTAADGQNFIVKLASPLERQEILTFQTEALLHLASKDLSVPLPRPVATRNGDYIAEVQPADERRMLRVLTYLDGTLLFRIEPSIRQMRSIGNALGALNRALSDFKPVVPRQSLLWDLCTAAELRQYLPSVAQERRVLVAGILDALAALEQGALKHVRRQIIHNDFNPHNILVDDAEPSRVTGVIDFGDMVEAPLVNDIAVALSYQVAAGEDLSLMLAMLGAFQAVQPLEPDEIDCLPALIRGRLAMTITITEWRAALYPENRAYILRNHPLAERGLKKLSAVTDAELADLFRTTLGDRR